MTQQRFLVSRLPWLPNLVGCLFLMAAAGDISVLLGQDANWDLRNYHWYNAYAFLENRWDIDIAPAQLQTFHNPLLDIPYYWVATAFPEFPAYPAFLQGSYYGLLVFFVIKSALCLLPFSPAAGSAPPALSLAESGESLVLTARFPFRALMLLVAVAIGATGVVTLSQLGSTMNEVQVSALVVAGIYCLLLSLEAPRPLRWIVVAGGLIGAAAGLKLTAVTFAIGTTLALGAVIRLRSWPWRWHALFMLAVLASFLALHGPWMLKLYDRFGSPLFPYYNQIFASEWWEASALKTSRFFPRDIWQWLFYPFYWSKLSYSAVMDATFRDPRLAAACLAAIGIVVGLVRRAGAASVERQRWWLLIVFFVVSYLAWLAMFSIYRYLIPLEAMSGLLIMGAFHWLEVRKTVTAVVAPLATVAILMWTVYPDWGHTAFARGAVAAEVPALPPNSFVLLMGGQPMAYVIPSFPKETRFIGIGNNLIQPGMGNRLQRAADMAIREHAGPIFFIESVSADRKRNDQHLAYYHLRRSQCDALPTSLEPEGLYFCATQSAEQRKSIADLEQP